MLIVDDNVELAENIAEILAMDGHLTTVAVSAEEALVMAKDCEPDFVVTDYRLPGMNGADFVKRLQSSVRGTVRAVVVSAYTDDRTIREATDAGAAFVAKPVDFQILMRLLTDASA
ncbi:MAG TPA: response regulator [Polyangia bacterium]|nr:response regulator [Polyangia bacterium]